VNFRKSLRLACIPPPGTGRQYASYDSLIEWTSVKVK
jgi:hypothetical protein